MTDQILDCKQVSCPMPIVRLSMAVKKMISGETLTVEATDPAFRADVEAWVQKTGNILVSFTHGDVQCAVIRKP